MPIITMFHPHHLIDENSFFVDLLLAQQVLQDFVKSKKKKEKNKKFILYMKNE